MHRLTTLTAAAALLGAPAAFAQNSAQNSAQISAQNSAQISAQISAQSSIDAPNGGRETGRGSGHSPGQLSGHVPAPDPDAASTRVSARRKRSGEGCSPTSTTGHQPGAATPEKTAASPPANGAVDQHASPAAACPPKGRS